MAGPFDMLQIAGSALSAERQRSEVIASNMANAETTHTDGGGPYKRKEVVFASSSNSSFIWRLRQRGTMLAVPLVPFILRRWSTTRHRR